MSAIWGVVDFQNQSVNKDIARRMENPYYAYKIDVYNKYITKNTLLGYGGQYFTREAKNETQPIVNEEEHTYFLADVVLDNREALFDMLDIKKEKRNDIADGTLMYQILRRYGKESYNMFLGTYAFAYYDKKKQEVILVCDSVGSRSLYYYYDQGKLYFSTLIKPILEARNAKTEWNYRFLSDYLALDNLALYTEAEETPYQKLYKVAPGQVVTVKEEGLNKEDYWDPLVNSKEIKNSNEDLEKEFVSLFDTCVSSIMRSSDKTGILLSGGLDSTSVACFAAPKLKEKSEMLYSYTSIPEKEYISNESAYYITNEKKMVEITKEYLGNLSCSFLELSGVNGFDGASEYMERLELPYKSLQNIRWMHASAEKAAMDGCRIILTGQYGNITISFGDFEVHFNTLFRSGHFIKLVKEINLFCSKHHIRKKKTYRHFVGDIKSTLLKSKRKAEDMFADVYVNPKLVRKYDTKRRFKKNNYNATTGNSFTFRAIRPYRINKNTLIQIGELETHLSLDTGVLLRDPTKDRRMIEFCLRLPENQFVDKGVDRRLVRDYLKSYLPEDIIMDEMHRGLQSADTIDRIAKNWTQIYQECTKLLEEETVAKLLDTPKIKAKLKSYQKDLTSNDVFDVLKLLYSILMVKYMK